jgi:chromate transporter
MLMEIFKTFFKIGAFTFGGGYAMLPLIEKELVEKKAWISTDELVELYAIAQMTPGTIAINAATFIGSKLRGKRGGFMASLGVITPSLVVISLIYYFFAKKFENPAVMAVFLGIRSCIIALIMNSVIKILKTSIKEGIGYLLFFISFLALLLFKVSPIIMIISGAVFGVAICVLLPKKIESILRGK